mmetsp:Transcript_93453/g.136512  ORF Transcript_93453/g.136512 Transcript_93453/m.136512 type:complete len:228 (-) Transcript_93453:158-841(-)
MPIFARKRRRTGGRGLGAHHQFWAKKKRSGIDSEKTGNGGDTKSKKKRKCDKDVRTSVPKVLEVGAGCGLLGLVLSHLGAQVVLTEAAEAMQILTSNVDKKQNSMNLPPAASAQALKVDWTSEADIKSLYDTNPSLFDVIVGTDVIFNTTLVTPLLKLLHRVSHADTTVWLCMQQRCPDAHRMLIEEAPKYFELHDRSECLAAADGCSSAAELECFLFRLTCRKDVA